MTLAVAGVAAGAIFLIAIGIATSGSGSAVSTRLERYASGRDGAAAAAAGSGGLSEMISSSVALAQLNRVVERRDFWANLAREIARADLKIKVSEYLAIWAGAIVGLPLLFVVLSLGLPALRNPIALLIAALIGFMLPRFWLGRRIREVNLGLPFEQALENMVRRVRSDDLELMATAISIQHTVGGNLAEILDSIAFTIRERIRIKGEIRTLTAQQRLSGYVVGFLPISLAGFLFVAAPHFMDPMFQNPPGILGLPAGVVILAFGGFMMFIGFMLIRKIVDIEV